MSIPSASMLGAEANMIARERERGMEILDRL